MIAVDADFKMRLQQSVIANIVRDMFPSYWDKSDAAEHIKKNLRAMSDEETRKAADAIAKKYRKSVRAEIAELVEARDQLTHEDIAEEYGDLLFVMANLGRHLNVDPEEALRAANSKFTRRFRYIEAELNKKGKRPDQSNLEEMDALWDQAKIAEKISD